MIYDFFFFSSRRRHTRFTSDWSSDVCSSDLKAEAAQLQRELEEAKAEKARLEKEEESSKNDTTDLASELKAELDNLRKELENVDDEDSDEEDEKTPEDAKEDYAAKMAKKGATLPKGFIKDAKANTGH